MAATKNKEITDGKRLSVLRRDRRQNLAELRETMAVIAARSEEVQATKTERRSKKVAKKITEEASNFDVGENLKLPNWDTSGQTRTEHVTYVSVRSWFREEITKWLGGKVTIPPDKAWWTWADKNSAKRLLDRYGPEIVRRAVAYMAEHWTALVDNSDGKISGIPNVRLLNAMAERLIGDMERGVKPKRRVKHGQAEWRPEWGDPKRPKVGW